MAESHTRSGERERVEATNLSEGDRVFMGVSLHGLTDDVPGTQYDEAIHQSGVVGEVTEALSDFEAEMLEENRTPMANVKVESDDGHTFTWNVDNGYVIGYNEKHGMTTDVGKIAGFYEA